jgi:hypothetical protein
MQKLGKLENVGLREAWNHEALDFTNWLAEEDNLSLLSEELGIDNIHILQTEANAGDFKIDILAEDDKENKIVIENQLEKTNHDHLGKILTYASSQDAKYIIWIAKEIRDEHKQAIDWLNEHTDGDINFFAVQIELWKIGESLPAPKFNIISKPNDWTNAVKKSIQENTLTDTKMMQFEFWKKFKEYADDKNTSLRLRSPRAQHWYSVAIGSSQAHLSFTVNSKEKCISCEIYISHNKELFNQLKENKEEIEKILGANIEWMELEDKEASRIKLTTFSDFTITDAWNNYFDWMISWGEKFQKVFGNYIKRLP